MAQVIYTVVSSGYCFEISLRYKEQWVKQERWLNMVSGESSGAAAVGPSMIALVP